MKNFIKALFGGLLTVLGFGSCDVVGGGMMCMYGQPHADFTVKGTVTDEEGEPVKGIKTVVDAYYKWTDHAGINYSQLDYSDTLYTDEKGQILKKATTFSKPGEIVVTLIDVDGEANGGEFEEQVINNLQAEQVKDSDGWYTGGYETGFKATLKKRN